MRYDHFSMLPEQAFSPIGKRMTLEGGGGSSWVAPVLAVAAVVVAIAAPYVAPAIGAALAGDATAAAGILAAETTAAATAAAGGEAALAGYGALGAGTIGAAGGAVAGTAQGGDAIWRGAVTNAVGSVVGAQVGVPISEAVGGAVGGTVGETAGKILGGIAGGATGGAVSGGTAAATGAAITDKSIGESALLGAEKGGVSGAITGGLAAGGRALGEAIYPTQYGDYYNPEEGAFKYDPKTGDWTRVATYDESTGQYLTDSGEQYTPQEITTSYGSRIGGSIGKLAGEYGSQYAKSELFPTQTTSYSGGTATGAVGDTGAGGKTDQVLYPQFGTGSSALAQALRTASPAAAIGGGGVEPSGGEGEQQSVWNISSLKLKDALGA